MKVFKKENPNILNKFLHYLDSVKHYSIKTIAEYGIDLMVFFNFIKEFLNLPIDVKDFNLFTVQSVKEADIFAFLVYLNDYRDCTASTRSRKIAAIKAFYKWLYVFYPNEHICSPVEYLPSIQAIKRLPKYLSLNDSKKLINVYNSKNTKSPERNNAILALFLNCGLRVSELININVCDLNLKDGFIRIIGKGDKERMSWLNEFAKEELEKYLEVRNRNLEVVDISAPLFLSSRKERLSARSVEVIVENAYKLVGLGNRGYTTHTLRHTAATLMYQYVKPDILLLKEFLGHSTIKSTEIYTHVSDERIRDAFNSNPLSNYDLEHTA